MVRVVLISDPMLPCSCPCPVDAVDERTLHEYTIARNHWDFFPINERGERYWTVMINSELSCSDTRYTTRVARQAGSHWVEWRRYTEDDASQESNKNPGIIGQNTIGLRKEEKTHLKC